MTYLARARVKSKFKCRKQSHAAACFPHATTCQVGVTEDVFENMSEHVKTMLRHDDVYMENLYFWQVGFRTPIVTLLLCSYKKG